MDNLKHCLKATCRTSELLYKFDLMIDGRLVIAAATGTPTPPSSSDAFLPRITKNSNILPPLSLTKPSWTVRTEVAGEWTADTVKAKVNQVETPENPRPRKPVLHAISHAPAATPASVDISLDVWVDRSVGHVVEVALAIAPDVLEQGSTEI
ncbi:hypothetical protein IFM89_027657 [Coptis chinensis]|uniref:Uncharacterized protein n=1 Tax=Coptis chinensis TaxID=261450 RepID=A0A835IVG5_9MAGN|nr:hypothetical protein IFM89_027657 [Coptis chinensis]